MTNEAPMINQYAWPMIEFPSPFHNEQGVVRLLEDRNIEPEVLRTMLIEDNYDRPFVLDDGNQRSLQFSLRYVQSVMRIRNPIALELAYTQKMMSFLLFQKETQRILVVGLGGGSLPKFCYAHMPLCQITVVEIDPYVIAFRNQFLIPADNERFRIIHDDAAKYIEHCNCRPDVILMDAFDRDGFSASIESREFYLKARSVLSPNGLLVANLAGSMSERLTHLSAIQEAFEDRLLIVRVGSDGNHVVVAFRNKMFEPRWPWVESKAKELQSRFLIDFPRITKKLEQSRELDDLERISNVAGIFGGLLPNPKKFGSHCKTRPYILDERRKLKV